MEFGFEHLPIFRIFKVKKTLPRGSKMADKMTGNNFLLFQQNSINPFPNDKF